MELDKHGDLTMKNWSESMKHIVFRHKNMGFNATRRLMRIYTRKHDIMPINTGFNGKNEQ